MKNEDYNLSLAITSAFDADILRKACNWIVENKEGYYITEDPDVFKEWSIRYTAYARTILRTEAAMRKRLMGR